MRRSELEKLTTVSVGGRLYVAIDEVLEALKAKAADAKEAAEPVRSVPRLPETPAEKG